MSRDAGQFQGKPRKSWSLYLLWGSGLAVFEQPTFTQKERHGFSKVSCGKVVSWVKEKVIQPPRSEPSLSADTVPPDSLRYAGGLSAGVHSLLTSFKILSYFLCLVEGLLLPKDGTGQKHLKASPQCFYCTGTMDKFTFKCESFGKIEWMKQRFTIKVVCVSHEPAQGVSFHSW